MSRGPILVSEFAIDGQSIGKDVEGIGQGLQLVGQMNPIVSDCEWRQNRFGELKLQFIA